MPIPESDPRAQDLDAAFAQAMDAPARPVSVAKPPPEVDREAPHGRDENGVPLEPFGRNKDGSVRKSASGRKAKDSPDRPRTTTEQDGDGKADPRRPSGKSYLADLTGFADMVWFGTSALGSYGSQIPFIGRLIPEDKLAAQALVIAESKPRLVAAIDLAAQHNAKAEDFCRKLAGGDGFWALQCMFMIMPVVSMSAAVWQGDKALAEMDPTGETTLKALAERNKDQMDEFMARIAAQMEAAAQQAASVPGEVVPDAGTS